jgi:hypothetical protein
MADADPAHANLSEAEAKALMDDLDRFNPAFTEAVNAVADRRAGERKARVNAAVAELTPLLALADTPQHLGGYQLPGFQVAAMATAVHNQKVPDATLMPVRRLVNADDDKSVLADVIRELHRQGVQNAPERVAALYIASRLPKIEGTPTMRQVTERTREIRRLSDEFDRRLRGAIREMRKEKWLQDALRAKGRTGLKRGGKRRTRKRTRKQIRTQSKRGRKGTRRSGRR